MRAVLLVSAAPAAALDIAQRWSAAGDDVALVLLDAAVTSARVRHRAGPALRAAVAAGVTVHAESGALARRGLDASTLAESVKPADLDDVAEEIMNADKAVWL